MNIIGTNFRKEELSIISSFVSQRMGEEIGPVATSKKVYIHLSEREKKLSDCCFLKRILNQQHLNFNELHILRIL